MQPAPPPLLASRTWGVAGVVLLGGVVVWRLAAASYRGDVETICSAESRSRLTLDRDMAKLTAWVRGHLTTPEGNELFSSLAEIKLVDRARRLEGEASRLRLRECPMVRSYERVAAQGDYRSDLQHLCSSAAFPRLSELDDAGRLARLEGWIGAEARSPRTKELAEPLRAAATGADRARVLREAAGKMDVYSCDGARALEAPQTPPPSEGPSVRISAKPQMAGAVSEEELSKAADAVAPAIGACYRRTLVQAPTLAGKMTVTLEIDAEGKVIRLAPAEVSPDLRDAAKCAMDGLRALRVAPNPGPLTPVLSTVEFYPGEPGDAGLRGLEGGAPR